MRPRNIFALGGLAIVTSLGTSGWVHAGTNRLQPGAHELRLDGIVKSVDVAKSRLVMDVASYTLPNGRSKVLSHYTEKTILFGKGASVHPRGNLQLPLKLSELKPGSMAVVIGRDLGQGQPLPLREMLVWSPATPIPPAAVSPPAVEADA